MSGSRKTGLIAFGALLVVLFAGVAIAQGIGNPSVPSGNVALVEDVPDGMGDITQAKYDTAFLQAWKRSGLQQAPKKSDAQFDQVKEAAMNDLLDQAWLTGEASELGITASDREVKNEFDTIRQDQFPSEKAYQDFLEQSGFTNDQVLERVKLQVLSRKIEEKIRNDVPPVSEEEIQDYYDSSKEAFTTPESRDIRLIVVSSKDKADEVETALADDDSDKAFAELARKYSVNPTKNRGGKTVASEGTYPDPAGSAIMDAAEGDVEGPIKVEDQYYFFRINKITPEKVQDIADVRSQISQQLLPTKQQQALTDFVAAYTSKWTSRTFCAEDYLVVRCDNYVGDGRNPAADPACFEDNAGDRDRKGAPSCPTPVQLTTPIAPGGNASAGPVGALAVTGKAQGPIPAGGQSTAPPQAPAQTGTIPPTG